MEKRKKWHFYLICSVLVFTLYSIIPTIIYYSKPLNKTISSKEASNIADGIVTKLESNQNFIYPQVKKIISYLNLTPKSIHCLEDFKEIVEIELPSEKQAKSFATSLIYGEKNISSKSKVLCLDNISINETGSTSIIVSAKDFLSASKNNFTFIPKNKQGELTSSYLDFLEGISDQIVYNTLNINHCNCYKEYISEQEIFSSLNLLEDLENYKKVFSHDYYYKAVLPFIIREGGEDLRSCVQEELEKDSLFCKQFLKEVFDFYKVFNLSESTTNKSIEKSIYKDTFFYKLTDHIHPLFESIIVNVNTGAVNFVLSKEIINLRSSLKDSEVILINSFIGKEIFRLEKSLLSGCEDKTNFFTSKVRGIGKETGLLVMDGSTLSAHYIRVFSKLLENCWKARTIDLSTKNYPIFFNVQPKKGSPLGCYIFSKKEGCVHFPRNSIFVVFKGIYFLEQNILSSQDESHYQFFKEDLLNLYSLLVKRGFSFQKKHQDQVFYLKNFESILHCSTKENFLTLGNYIILETFDVKHRLLLNNKIDTEFHEELVKWYDDYQKARNRTYNKCYLEVLPPVKNVFYENFKLSIKKYFSGDESRVLKWGLDLSGGKTVRIGFQDQNNKLIVNSKEIDKAAQELSQRLNRLGVAEILVRREGHFVNVSFPSTYNVPAEELITSSTMKFHVVNEKFSCIESPFYSASKLFLDRVWAIASSQNTYDPISLNKIGKNLLDEASLNPDNLISKQMRVLFEAGLCIPGSEEKSSKDTDNKYSWIVRCKDQQEGINPLTIVYYNYALEGADLTNITTSFDTRDGNILQFCVKKSVNSFVGKTDPSEDFYKWTSSFSTAAVHQSELSKFSAGKGWRMAVILNDLLINAPQLNSPLKDKAQITGAFSQREVLKLASDLKLGTMSYKPIIMSEDTISAELGLRQKIQGVVAALLGLIAVIVIMCAYYRIAGFIAILAVILNLIIIWGLLQNIGATLTLSSIAGIILAMGMAVDANVLVFERIREELKLSGRLSRAIKIGYKRAFGAILDSNVTTILAACILLFFDVGPVKGFAVTLIIGILSSMFTSLFMTRFFFSYWLEYSQKATLNMSSLFMNVKLNFINGAKKSWIFSGILFLFGLGSLFFGEVQDLISIDFKGGYVLSLNDVENQSILQNKVPQVLKSIGINSSDFQFRSLNQDKKVKIYFSNSGINQLKAINIPLCFSDCNFEYQKDHALSSVIRVLLKAGANFDQETLSTLHLNWSGVSGQFSTTMRKQAILGLIGALLVVLIYVCVRFEIAYAVSAVGALLHDLLVTSSVLVVAHCFVKSVQLDFQIIGALMTILGYSLNNTIVIFDRIREKEVGDIEKFHETVKESINDTFSRTMMTTVTTLVVVLFLLLFGGSSLLGFSLTMISGVLLGAISSIYLAPTLLIVIKKKKSF